MTSLRRLLPSASALFVFEAAARYMSFTQAAGELSVTQSAVSRMIARFEAHLGVKLFRRSPAGIELTEEGRQLYDTVTGSFQRVAMTLEEIRRRRGDKGTVTLSISSAFAMHWFMPRMDRFERALPDIDLRFHLMRGEPLGPVQDVDLGMWYDTPDDANHLRWPLVEEEVVPVCSPGYARAHGTLDGCRDMARHTLVHLSGVTRIPWSRYLAEFGYPAPVGSRSLTFSDYSLVIQAAVGGRGVALGWWHVVAHALRQGVLVPAAGRVSRTKRTYYLVATRHRPLRKPAALVRDWLLEEMAAIRREEAPVAPARPRSARAGRAHSLKS
jgi:LysR family transcriptional regulator, glycine cleavage system transcriptional activator